MTSLPERIRELLNASPIEGNDYFALTVFASNNGRVAFSCFTGWVGYTEETPKREIREASLVIPDRMLRAWRETDGMAMVVNTADDFALFLAFGGHAIVEKGLAQAAVPEWLAPHVSINVGEWGYASPNTLPPGSLQRAPSPKLRMQILKRDGYKCRVCGRSPSTNVDLELHVHHVRPWACGGVTEERNLITLCHTCHNGLDPHFEFSLFRLLIEYEDENRPKKYFERLRHYQESVKASLGA